MLVFVYANMKNELNVALISTKMQTMPRRKIFSIFLLYPNYD
jgi:hypothetical protein